VIACLLADLRAAPVQTVELRRAKASGIVRAYGVLHDGRVYRSFRVDLPNVDPAALAPGMPLASLAGDDTPNFLVYAEEFAIAPAARKALRLNVVAECPESAWLTGDNDGNAASFAATAGANGLSPLTGPATAPAATAAALASSDDEFARRRKAARATAARVASVADAAVADMIEAFHPARGVLMTVGTQVVAVEPGKVAEYDPNTYHPVWIGVIREDARLSTQIYVAGLATIAAAATAGDVAAEASMHAVSRASWVRANDGAFVGTVDGKVSDALLAARRAGVPDAEAGERMFHNPNSASGGKWWAVSVSEVRVRVRFGAVSTAGQSREIDHGDAEQARDYVRNKINEKTQEGYGEVR